MSYGRSPPNIGGMESLKVDNLTYRTTPDELRRAFDKYGEVGDVYIPRDRFTKESRGFAFVRFYDKRDADDAMRYMDGAIIDGRELRVQKARYGRPNNERRPRGGGRNEYRRRPRARSYSRSRSRSRSRGRKRHGRSRSRTRSKSRSRNASNSKSKSRSPSRSYSRSNRSKSKSKTRSRTKSEASVNGERSRSRSRS